MSATNRKSLIGHNYRKHKTLPEPVQETDPELDAMDEVPPDEQVVDDDSSHLASMDENRSPAVGDMQHTPVPANAFHMFTNGPTIRFFEDLQSSTLVAAVQHLVARACYQNTGLMPGVSDATITVKDLCLFFRIARLVFRMGTTHHQLLGSVLLGFEQRHPSQSAADTNLPLPTTHKAFVAKLLNPTNTNSLTSILPLPPTVSLSEGHAYVPLGPLLAYELSLADASIDPPYHAKFQRLVDSQHGQELFEHGKRQLLLDHQCHVDVPVVLYVVFLLYWFDGWDPNGSSKGNRSPIWSGTITIVCVDMEGLVVLVATHSTAAGPGKADHDVIFRHIHNDLHSLQASLDNSEHGSSRWFYSRRDEKMSLVYGELFCIWQDQPARRQETNTLGGNSNNHTIFGTSCFVKHLNKPLAACAECNQATNHYLRSQYFDKALCLDCSNCTNWSIPADPKINLYNHPISDKFPADAVAGKDFNNGAGPIESTVLIAAWREACEAVVSGRWNDGVVQVYMKTLCVNEATVKAMIRQCKSHVLWVEIGQAPDDYDAQTCAETRRQYALNPDAFTIPGPPAAWLLAPLSLHVETIMHLAGGVQKAVAKFVHRYATSLGHGPALTARLAYSIALLHKYCRVQYLPLARYNTDKFGGWVMENFKSLCKLAPPPPFVEPTSPRSTWTQRQNMGYLRARNPVATPNLNAADAKQAVSALFSATGGPPPPLSNPARLVTPHDLRHLLLTCHTMFKELMQVTHDKWSINRTEARVKAFLSEIERLDVMLQPARTKPLYLAKYNFPSLLRAVTHLRKFGNIRDLHEGGIEGEGMVKVLRPLVPRGLKPNFATHLLRKVLRDSTLDRIMQNLDTNERTDGSSMVNESDDKDHNSILETLMDKGQDEEEESPFLCDDPDVPHCAPLLFRRYNSRATLEHYLRTGVPLSVVFTNQDNNQRIGVIVSMCNQWILLPLNIGRMCYNDDLGFTYFDIWLHAESQELLVREKAQNQPPTYHIKLVNYGLLLPAQWLNTPCPYALMTMEGEYLNEDYSFV